MKVSSLIQQPRTQSPKTIKGELKAKIHAASFDHVRVAMAYVTIGGVRALLDAFAGRKVVRSQWLVGLDDAVTQPGAIDFLIKLEGAELRVATLEASSFRFHPKVCRLEYVSGEGKELLMIGSANLTSNALAGNSEAVVFLEAGHPIDKNQFSRIWQDLWSQGHKPSEDELAAYKKQYDILKKTKERLRRKLKAKRTQLPNKPGEILQGDEAELDPARANICWIECGYITLMGRELEFKAEQGLFFGLEPAGGKPKMFRFQTSDGSVVPLRMKYQVNHMWRLQMNKSIPEVKQGLRPIMNDGKLGRSTKVAVFTRTDTSDMFRLRFLELNSQLFERLRRKSSRVRAIGHTSARAYGWC